MGFLTFSWRKYLGHQILIFLLFFYFIFIWILTIILNSGYLWSIHVYITIKHKLWTSWKGNYIRHLLFLVIPFLISNKYGPLFWLTSILLEWVLKEHLYCLLLQFSCFITLELFLLRANRKEKRLIDFYNGIHIYS